MKAINKSVINSIEELGPESYTTFSPIHSPGQIFYQYYYQHTDGRSFSCSAPTLERCREKRDKWLYD